MHSSVALFCFTCCLDLTLEANIYFYSNNSQICNSQNILMVCNGMGERITDKNLFEPGVWLTEFLLKWCLTLEDQHPQALFPGRS